METVVIFMISTPWSSIWWLGHNVFLLSYISIGIGILFSLFSEEKFEYFDVMGQLNEYVDGLKEANDKLNTLANKDILTGLPNGNYFMNYIEETIAESKKNNSIFFLLFIDLDGFKKINDTFGHDIGDEVLRLVALRIKRCIKNYDIVARLGGDEFILLVKDTEVEEVGRIAERIVDLLNNPFVIENNICKIGASIGISMFPKHGISVKELIINSDKAMYEVKLKSKNGYAFFKD